MSTTEKITVTAEHIAAGKPHTADACPIALAILAQHPDAPAVDVYSDMAILAPDADSPMLTARMPDVASAFILRFDSDEAGGPIEFELTWQTLAEADAS